MEGGALHNKMKFAPGWNRGSSSVGLVRSALRPGASGGSATSATSATQAAQDGQAVAKDEQGVPPVLPPPPPSNVATPYAQVGKQGSAPRAPPPEDATSRMATLGRVPAGSSGGKLTAQANLYHQQTRANPAHEQGEGEKSLKSTESTSQTAPRIRFSRQEMLLFASAHPTRPEFPEHVPAGLVSEKPLLPLLTQAWPDRDGIYRRWQEECEKRGPARSGHVGGAPGMPSRDMDSRRGLPPGTARGRVGPALEPTRGRNLRGEPSWRNPSNGGAPMGPPRDGMPMNRGGNSRWSEGSGRENNSNNNNNNNRRWNEAPGMGPRREPPSTGGRWDRLFGDSGSGGRAFGQTRDDRFGNNNPNGGNRRDARNAFGSYNTQENEPYDDRGTFSEEAMSGSFNLQSMAAAASRFQMEMEEHRRNFLGEGSPPKKGSVSDADVGARNAGGDGGGFFAFGSKGEGSNPALDGALEEGLEQPPEEDTPPEESIDGSDGRMSTQQRKDSNPQQQGNTWMEKAQPQIAQGSGGWHVPPTNSSIPAEQQQQEQQQQQDGYGAEKRTLSVVDPRSGTLRVMNPTSPQMPPHESLPRPQPQSQPRPQQPQEDDWYYRDPQGNIQGPFKSEEMREWLEHGYFNLDLLIRRGTSESFMPLGQRFPNRNNAFIGGDSRVMLSHSQMQMWQNMTQQEPQPQNVLPQPQQQQQQRRQAEERIHHVEKQKAEWAAKEKQEREQQQERARINAEAKERERRKLEEDAKRQKEFERKRMEQQEAAVAQQQKNRQEAERQRRAEAERRRKAEEKPAWGGAAKAGSNQAQKLSLKEIQQLEEQEARKSRSTGPGPNMSMAARIAQAAGVSKGRPNATGMPAHVQQQQGQNIDSSMLDDMTTDLRKMLGVGSTQELQQTRNGEPNSGGSQEGGWITPSSRQGNGNHPKKSPEQQQQQQQSQRQPNLQQKQKLLHTQQQRSTSSVATSNFGKQMSPDMRKWVRTQLPHLNASMDLIEFCYSLESASEIREYLRDYLGSTPEVSSFASEFIARKSGKPLHEGFGTETDAAGFQPAVAKRKKNRKKKSAEAYN